MNDLTVPPLLLAAAYLIGSIPFGYLIGRARGVDLFKVGSGNIGATNVGRVLGPAYGMLCFVLDFLKGSVPVALITWYVAMLEPQALWVHALPAAAAALAFAGHLFPFWLGFKGGKGVATGAGVISVLVPGPLALAVAAWLLTVFLTRTVSLASIAAVIALSLGRLVTSDSPFSDSQLPVTLLVFVGSLIVILKHWPNMKRLWNGNENRIQDRPMRQLTLKAVHLLALGTAFGGAAFFNFVAALTIFSNFETVVEEGPSDRTAQQTIISPDASQEDRQALASALARSAVGPIFPKYFMMQAVCVGIALITALGWWRAESGRFHKTRVVLLILAAISVAVGWWVSEEVSAYRLARFSADPEVAEAAKAAFRSWHFISLAQSFVTIGLTGTCLALGAGLPAESKADKPAE